MLPVRPECFEVLRFGASAQPRGFQARGRDAADPDPSPLFWASRLCAWRLRPACEGACVDSCPSLFSSFIDVLVFSCLVYWKLLVLMRRTLMFVRYTHKFTKNSGKPR